MSPCPSLPLPPRPPSRFAASAGASVGPGSDLLALQAPPLERAYEKGQSKRIWGELYKVLDSSDVIIEVGGPAEACACPCLGPCAGVV